MTALALGRRWPWYLLIASLATNMLLIGIFVGQVMFGHPPPPPPGPAGLERFIDRVSERLSAADAAVLRDSFEEKRSLFDRLEDNRDSLRRGVDRALRSDPFDANGLTRTFDDFHRRENAISEEIDGAVVDVLSRLSAEGRRTLAAFRDHGP